MLESFAKYIRHTQVCMPQSTEYDWGIFILVVAANNSGKHKYDSFENGRNEIRMSLLWPSPLHYQPTCDPLLVILASHDYRPRSEGDNALGSVRLSVRLCALSRLNRLTYNKSHYQFKVFVCVSVISGHMRIIARMRSIGVLIIFSFLSNVPSIFSKTFICLLLHNKTESQFF